MRRKMTVSHYQVIPENGGCMLMADPGSHVIICHEENTIPKETKRDAAALVVHHSKPMNTKMSRVNLVRVDQVIKDERIKNHGQVYLDGEVMQLTVFMNKEKERLDRLLKNRNNS
jgi:predicted ribosome quality control (RQC) complex YloA/Tae2 family protein